MASIWSKIYYYKAIKLVFDFPTFRYWACRKNAFPETCRAHTIWYLRFYAYSFMSWFYHRPLRPDEIQIIKPKISNLACTTRFYNNLGLYQVRLKGWNLKVFGSKLTKRPTQIKFVINKDCNMSLYLKRSCIFYSGILQKEKYKW